MSLTKATLSMIEVGLACIEDFGASTSASAADNAAAINAALIASAAEQRVLTTRSTGIFEVTGTFTIPAGVEFVGRESGEKPTLQWSGSEGPSDLITQSAFVLAGDQSALNGWNINMDTTGDFRRTVSMGGYDNQSCTRNKITLNLTGVDSVSSHFTIFCAASSLFYAAEISENEITGYVNTAVDGMQMSYSVNAKVINNYIHDLTKGTDPGPLGANRFSWGLYCSQRCYGLLLSGNIVQNTNMSGIRVSNAGTGAASDYGRRATDNFVTNVDWVGFSFDLLNGATSSGNSVFTSGYPMGILGCLNSSFTNSTLKNFVETSPLISVNKPFIDVINSCENITLSDICFDTEGDGLRCIYIESSNITISNIAVSSTAPIAIIQTSSSANNITINNVNAEAPTSTVAGNRIFIEGDNSIITNCLTPCSATGQIGIRSSGDRNIFNNNRASGGTNCIFLSSTSTNSIALGNIASGASSTFILDSGTGNVLANNIIV